MSAHTPGPWKCETGLGCKTIKGGKAGTHKQAQYTEIAYTVGLSDEATDRANGTLLALAPELLAALKDVVRSCRKDFRHEADPEGAFRKAYAEELALIAKAEGRA